jgi:DNA-directed RNA polymerase subunit RPC12/RpoP
MKERKLKTPIKKLETNRRYRQRNREAVLYHKRNARLRRFGLEPEDLTELLEKQDYKCAACGKGPLERDGRKSMSACLDHDHATGELREILCKRCNVFCGYIENDIPSFIKVMKYLLKHDNLP